LFSNDSCIASVGSDGLGIICLLCLAQGLHYGVAHVPAHVWPVTFSSGRLRASH